MSNVRVAVIAGGPSSEAEVSRTSARAVAEALSDSGFSTQIHELTPELPEALAGAADVVFPVVHGPMGEDGCLQGLLEVMGFRYVGSGVLASALAANKPRAKELFAAAGLPIAPSHWVRRDADLNAAARSARQALGDGVVVKPGNGGSAIGVTRVRASEPIEGLVQALEQALSLDHEVLVEELRVGSEVTCGVLDLEHATALPVTKIEALAADWYDFKSRYGTGGSRHLCPAPFSPDLAAQIQDVARRAHLALGCRDLSRADFVVDEAKGRITLLEVNTLPGMTGTSLFPEAAAVAGVTFKELCRRLVERALARPERFEPAPVAMPD